MARLRIDPLDPADPMDAQRVSEVFARADAVDRPWHPGDPAADVQVLATHGNAHMIAVNERLGYRVMGRSVEFQRDVVGPLSASSRAAGGVTGTA